MKREVNLFLEDILENIELIENSKGISLSEIKSNRLLFDATLRRLEIIGEAVKNIPSYFRKRYSEVPWKDIAGFRDILTHAYFGVILERIWNVIKNDLPVLKKQIKEILGEENAKNSLSGN